MLADICYAVPGIQRLLATAKYMFFQLVPNVAHCFKKYVNSMHFAAITSLTTIAYTSHDTVGTSLGHAGTGFLS